MTELFATRLTTTFGVLKVMVNSEVLLQMDGDVVCLGPEATKDLIGQMEAGIEAHVAGRNARTGHPAVVVVAAKMHGRPAWIASTGKLLGFVRDVSRRELLGALRVALKHANEHLVPST